MWGGRPAFYAAGAGTVKSKGGMLGKTRPSEERAIREAMAQIPAGARVGKAMRGVPEPEEDGSGPPLQN